jgi:hypothetical protein
MGRGQYQGKSPDPGTIAGRSERVVPGTAGNALLRHSCARCVHVPAGQGNSGPHREIPGPFPRELSDPAGILYP